MRKQDLENEHHAKNLTRLFKGYSSDMKDVWESYVFIDKYMNKIHGLIKDNTLPVFSVVRLANEDGKESKISKNRTFGYVYHIVRTVNPNRSLITAVSLTEDFLQGMVKSVYKVHPERLSGNEDKDAPVRIEKVIDVVLLSEDKDEILDRLIEEKVRGIFYGNPVDFFLKDQKIKLQFGNLFKDNHSKNIELYSEIVARRNIYAHNGGRIDRKYLKETKGGNSSLGGKIPITSSYLKESIQVLRGLSAIAAFKVCEGIFKSAPPTGRLWHVYNEFNSKYSDSARKSS